MRIILCYRRFTPVKRMISRWEAATNPNETMAAARKLDKNDLNAVLHIAKALAGK